MKKLLLLSTLSLFAFSVLISSCKKENANQQMEKLQIMSSSMNVQVSSDGYLQFNDIGDFNLFSDFLETNSYDDILNYFESIDFTPMGLDKYPGFESISYLSEEMMPYFILSANTGVFQIKNTIFKPNEEGQYVLTLNIENLNEDNLNNLISFNFDETVMNRYTSNGTLITQINPLEILESNPIGIDEVPSTDPPMNTMRGFWKNEVHKRPCDVGGRRLVTVVKYRFWIRWDEDTHYEPC